LGVSLSPVQKDLFVRYCVAISSVNARMNLTAARSPQSIMRTLFLDSLTIAPALPAPLRDKDELPRPVAVDVGSGAGIPGLPLKIVYPHWSLALVESIAKKARFLEAVVAELELADVAILPKRAEELGRGPPWRDAADLCLARAVARLPTLVEQCAPLVKAGGHLIFPKSGDVEAEVQSAQSASRALRVELHAVVPVSAELGLGPGRALVIYQKTSATPPGYPRRTGLARSRPIRNLSRRSP
jgi:16S rRNA (guanine527-N7)-methyltransferase